VSEVPKVDLPSEQKSKSLDLSNVLNNIRTIKEVSSRGDESVIKQESQPITKKKFN
jgi:hypothetical protein